MQPDSAVGSLHEFFVEVCIFALGRCSSRTGGGVDFT